MTRSLDLSIGEYYHVYSRGVDKRVIFEDVQDYQHFLKLLFLCNSEKSFASRNALDESYSGNRGETLVDIGAYCLMSNHFHLLVREKIENGTSAFMQKMLTAYAMYFNKKYKRTGALFESRFKARHAETDEYLKYLFAYIHLNPIKIMQPFWKDRGIQNLPGVKDFLDTYAHSSYTDYVSTRDSKQGSILNRAAFPEYFQNSKGFREFLGDWLTYKDVVTIT